MVWLLPESERVVSPNRYNGRGPWSGPGPDLLVLHYAVDGDQTNDNDPSTTPGESLSFAARKPSDDCMDVARFMSKAGGNSAHFVVGRDGSKVQLVDTDDSAFHAGGGAFPPTGPGPLVKPKPKDMNRRSIGIEICNVGWAVEKFDVDPQWRMKAAHPASPKRLQTWEVYRPVQYATLEYVAALLRQTVPSLEYVLSHEDVVNRDTLGVKYGGKVDTGPAFDWDRIDWRAMGYTPVRYDFKPKAWVEREEAR